MTVTTKDGWREFTVTRDEFARRGLAGIVADMKAAGFTFASENCPVRIAGEHEVFNDFAGGSTTFRQRVQ